MNAIAFENGTIIDGTGSAPYHGNVLIRGGKIDQVGNLDAPFGARHFDCAGLVLAPGFIDVHSHSDLQVLENRPEKLLQGVTTEVVGNCGFSAFPAAPDRSHLHEFANGIFCGAGDWGWPSAADYLDAVAAQTRVANVFALVGHGTLRISRAQMQQGSLTPQQVDAMEKTLDDCLTQGAAGFSTGLMYAPGSSAPFDELERLCRVVGRRGKIYATHMRSYFGDIVESIGEQIDLARRAGCRLQISHLLVAGRKNWDQQARALERIEQARAEGLDIAFDCYPYIAGSTVLTQILPQWALNGGSAAMLARFANSVQRERIAAETMNHLPWSWEDILISAVQSPHNQWMVGGNIAELATRLDKRSVDVVIDLLVEEEGLVNMISFNQSEENLVRLLTHPLSSIVSDGFYVKGLPHPRLFGTFPRMLGTYVRDCGALPLETAIHKMTLAPAARFGMNNLGRIAPGYQADIVVFNAREIGSNASYTTPAVPPVGVMIVMRTGELLYRDSRVSLGEM